MLTPPNTINPQDFRITLIGTGALGTALSRKLSSIGYQFVSIINRTLTTALPFANSLGVSVCSDRLDKISLDTNLVFIATNDSSIQAVAEQLSKLRLSFHQLTVVHFSGALTTDVLMPITKKGAIALSLHPFQTFSKTILGSELEKLFRCFFGLQADEVEGIDVGKRIAHDLGGKVMLIPKEAKTLYHIAAVMSCNYLVTLASLSSEIFATLGIAPHDAAKIIEPMMKQTLNNIISGETPIDALSGPIERGDADTIRRHLTELSEQVPHLLPIYSALAIETVRVAIHKGSIANHDATTILDYLEAISKSESTTENSG